MSAPTHCPYCNAQLSTRRLTRDSKAQCARCGTVFRAETGKILSPPANSRGSDSLSGACPSCGKEFALKAVVANPKVRCGKCGTAFRARDHAAPRPTPSLASTNPSESATIDAIIEPDELQPQPPVEPVIEDVEAESSPLKEGLLAFVILAAIVGAGWLLWTTLSGPKAPLLGDYAASVPKDASVVAFVNLEKLRTTTLYTRFHTAATRADALGGELDIKISDVDAIFFAGSGEENAAIVLRTTRDMTLRELAGKHIHGEPKEYESLPYAQLREGKGAAFIAKLAPQLYCEAPAEEILKALITQRKAGEPAPLSEGLMSLLHRVARHDHYLAVSDWSAVTKQIPMPIVGLPAITAVALGVTIDTDIELEVILTLDTAEAAKAFADLARTAIANLLREVTEKTADPLPDPPTPGMMLERALKDIDVSQDGSDVAFKVEAPTKNVEAVLNMKLGELPEPPNLRPSAAPPPVRTTAPAPPKATETPRSPETPKAPAAPTGTGGTAPIRDTNWD